MRLLLTVPLESGAGSSDNEDQDETMADVEEPEADPAPDLDNEMADDDDANEENEEDEDDTHDPTTTTQPKNPDAPPTGAPTDDRTREYRTPERKLEAFSMSPGFPGNGSQVILPEMLTADMYDIVPTIAAPHSTSINAVTATSDMRWVFSGGADGWIRKFNWVDTVNARTLLTVAQRHPFVDSVTKAGVLMSYWENEEPSGILS